MTYRLTRELDTGILTAVATVNTHQKLKLIVDTGATITTIDSNVLYMAGYRPEDAIGEDYVETANGIIQTKLFVLPHFRLFGIVHEDFVIQSHDFLEHGILSDYNGLLGLDFFEGLKFCLDMTSNELTVENMRLKK